MHGYAKIVFAAAALVVAAAAVTGCTNRPLSMMDTYWAVGNTHPHLVWKDGEVWDSDDPKLASAE